MAGTGTGTNGGELVDRGHRPDAARVRRMFADVAPRYDLCNHVLSGGVDALWRRRTVRAVLAVGSGGGSPAVLDLCTGTGDLALAMARAGCRVVGADFCPEMLVLGERKRRAARDGGDVAFLCADAQRLPFEADGFDAATVAFGIRNVEDPLRGLAEMARVVRPGGRVFVLEFSRPRTPILGGAYMWYFRRVLPRLGALLSRGSRASKAYDYLPESVMAFPDRERFCDLMRAAGLVDCGFDLLSFGVAALYHGTVPGPAGGDGA